MFTPLPFLRLHLPAQAHARTREHASRESVRLRMFLRKPQSVLPRKTVTRVVASGGASGARPPI